MFAHKHTETGTTGTVVAYRKAAVETYVLVDTGAGNYVQATMTRPRFDAMGLTNGDKVLVSEAGKIIGVGS